MSEDSKPEGLAERVRSKWADMSPAEQQLATFLLTCPDEQIVFGTAGSLGKTAGTSDATVIRTVKRLGYSGLPELKRDVGTTMARNVAPGVRLHQRIAQVGGDLGKIVDQVFDEASDRLEQTREGLDTEALEVTAQKLAEAREVVIFGAGASELAARHLALKLNRIGHRARYLSATGFNLADELLALSGEDAVVVFAPLRLLHEVEVLLDHARSLGAARFLVADAPQQARLADRVDMSLHAPHTPTGATAEGLPAVVVADIIVLAVAAIDEPRAVRSSEQLTRLRHDLVIGLDRRPRR